MLRRIKRRTVGGGDDLPTMSSAPTHSYPDGSGRSVKMEAPLVKSIRETTGYVRFTYGWFLVSVFMIGSGWRWISGTNASVFFDCHATKCELIFSPPRNFQSRSNDSSYDTSPKKKKRVKVSFDRDQLIRADNIKWDPTSDGGGGVSANYGVDSPSYNDRDNKKEDDGNDDQQNDAINRYQQKRKTKKQKIKQKKNKSNGYKRGGKDEDGFYDSYVVVLRDLLPPEEDDEGGEEEESASKRMQRQMMAQHRTMTHDPNSLASQLAPFLLPNNDSGGGDSKSDVSTEYLLHFRDYNVGQTRRLARSVAAKINAYAKGRRNKVTVRENRPVAWQGLLLLIFGIFSTLLSLLIGQFWEESDGLEGSHRKRMAELRRRNKYKTKRNIGTKPLMRAASNFGKGGSNERSRSSVRSAQQQEQRSLSGVGGTGSGSVKRGY